MRREGWFVSTRERAFWIGALATTLAIYFSLAWVRVATEWLRGQNLLRVSVGAIFLAAAAGIVVLAARRGVGRLEIAALAGCGLVYLLVLAAVELPEERVHFLQYGAVAGLAYGALAERWRAGRLPRRAVPAIAVVLGGLVGWVDEGIQAILPSRYYDLRDVGLNFAASALAVLSITVVAAARRAERAR